MFVASSCSDEQGGSNGEDARPEVREVTRTVTVAETPKGNKPPASEPGREAPAPPAASPAEQALAEPAAAEDSPEDRLALQYRLINAGDYEGAYALFDETSKQAISLEQYRAFFEANAPYSLTDYSFSSASVQGDIGTVEATFTANSASGQEQLQIVQQFVREGGQWRVLMREEQVTTFAGAEESAQYAPGVVPDDEETATREPVEPPSLTPEAEEPIAGPAPESTTQYQGTTSTPSAEEDLYDCPDFDFQEEAQAIYDADQSDPYGLDGLPGESSTGVPGVACEELPSRGGEVSGGTTEQQYGQ